MSTSRWLAWTPKGRKIEKTPDPELTKPTKPGSVSFVSGIPASSRKMASFATTNVSSPFGTDSIKSRLAFPHCPRCASYALYRKNNIGDYECLSCGMRAIDQTSARRLQ
jgi:hypothetical protein